VEKYATNLLILLGLIVSIATYRLHRYIQYALIFLILLMNTKLLSGDVLLKEVWTTPPVYSTKLADAIGDERVLYLPLIRNNPWTPETDGSFSYSTYPILYNTRSFTQNTSDINRDILDIYTLDTKFYQYQIKAVTTKNIVKKYNIQKVLLYKKYSYAYHFNAPSFEALISTISRVYPKIYEDSDVIVFDTQEKNRDIFVGLTQSGKINPTRYTLDMNLATFPKNIEFLQSYHRGWGLYLEPYSESEDSSYQLSRLWQTPLSDESHQIVYEYANQWMIDPAYIRANYPRSYYSENPDGTIDLRMTLYFYPQSYLYLGYIVLVGILILSLGYVMVR
jgi:hypothetical protein